MADRPHTTIDIRGVALLPIEHRQQRVVTLDMVDTVHQRPSGTAGRNFRANRERFLEGVDFTEITQPDEIRRLGLGRPDGSTPASVMLMTETGYLMLVKSFRDDLAWEVQRQLVNAYFRTKAEAEGLTAGQVGGVTRGVVRKALDERLEPVERAVLALAERVRMLSAPNGHFKTSVEFKPALAIAEEAMVPVKGRGPLVRRLSNALSRYCAVKGWLVRAEAHTERRLFHVEAIESFKAAGGMEIVRQHIARITGQSRLVVPFKIVPGGESN